MALHKKKNARCRRYPAETIAGADNADDLTLLANTFAESQLHSLEQTAGGTGLHVIVNKTEFTRSHLHT